MQGDLLETGPGDPVESIGVVSEPFGFVTRFREYQPVFHLDLGVDLSQASDELFRGLAGDLVGDGAASFVLFPR